MSWRCRIADAPALHEGINAVRGGGAWRGDRRLSASEVGELGALVVAYSPVEEWVRAGHEEQLLVGRRRPARATRGSTDAWGTCRADSASMEAVVEHEPCYAWDLSATGVIVEEERWAHDDTARRRTGGRGGPHGDERTGDDELVRTERGDGGSDE